MLTGFQAFFAACIGKTEDEPEPSSEAQQQDAHQTEPEIEEKDESTGDAEPETVEASAERSDSEENGPAPEAEEATTSEAEAGDTSMSTSPEGEEAEDTDSSLEAAAEEGVATAEEVSETTEAEDSSEDATITPPEEVPEAVEVTNPVPTAEDTPEAAETDNSTEEARTPSEDEGESETTEADSSSEETAAQPEAAETEKTEAEKMPLDLGIIEDIYDFVEMFEQANVSGTDMAAASGSDSSGGVSKPAIFEHPTATETAKIDYRLTLPEVDKKERLFLHFFIGLRDGVVFDDPEHTVGGVKFAIEVSDVENTASEVTPERCFESVSVACEWREEGVELTGYAGKEVVISFLTACNVAGNSSYGWALWGTPELCKFKETRLRKQKRAAEPDLYCGVAVLHFAEERAVLRTFSQAESTAVSDLVAMCLEAYVSEERPIKVSLYGAQPKLEIVNVGTTAAVVPAGAEYEVQCTLRNVGVAPLAKTDIAKLAVKGLKLRRGRLRQNVKDVQAGEEVTIFWIARRVQNPKVVPFSVALQCQTSAGETHQTFEGAVVVRSSAPKLPTKATKELHTYTEKQSVVFGNKHLRMVFVRDAKQTSGNRTEETADPVHQAAAEGFEYCIIFVVKNGHYHQVATCPALSAVTYLDSSQNRQTFQFVPTEYRLAGNSQGESTVYLSGDVTDVDGVKWSCEMQWSLSEESMRVKTAYTLETDGDRDLLAFQGPMLYAGQARQGEKKTAALFPGLELLEGDERSSSARDAAPPLDNRLVPHPYKITVPVMAVEMQKSIVGLAWDPLETWDGENRMLSAVFASPNWYQHQKNHLLGVFLPTVPTWVEENRTEASTAYPLKAAGPVSIKAEIIVARNASILDAVSHWNEAYGPVTPLPPPRNDEEEVLLSRHGFMETTWDESTRKSRHCVDWAAQNEPGFGTLLWYDYLATKDAGVKERVLEIADNIIRDSGAEGLAARGSCHILRWEFPFHIGHLEAALTHIDRETEQRIATQEQDGSWRWQPNSPKTALLGEAGAAVVGTCAESALLLLKSARITGNTSTREAGLKALKFMKQFSVPRGAQLWECPMYQPDILAAAHAVGAYVEAYELTGEKEYLQDAIYWAETGLPFLYHWHLPDRPGMQFASIPVFGTTFYTHSWFGVPVQWNGLVLAYYLQRLSQHTDDPRWHQTAEGITVSAMYQQWEEGDLKGTYPDGFYGFCTEGRGPHLNPEDIMVNVYALRGLDPGIKTAIADGVHVSSGAKVDKLKRSDNGRVNWHLSYVENETSYAAVFGYGSSPRSLQIRYPLHSPATADTDVEPSTDQYIQTDLPNVPTFEGIHSGWLYREDKDVILIKYLHPAPEVQFEIS